jgi:hypothetical protein
MSSIYENGMRQKVVYLTWICNIIFII